jgi:hypothetical protein
MTSTVATRTALNDRILKRFKGRSPDIEEAGLLLREYALWLENECHSTIAQHDPVFWLSVDRRFPAWVSVNKANGPNKKALQQELSVVKTALFFKYGATEMSKLDAYLDGTFGFEISGDDIVQLFGVVHTILDEITNLQGLYRRVNKGAKLTIAADGRLDADPDDQMIDLMLLYDRRRQGFSQTFSPIGFFSAFHARQEFPSVDFRADRWTTIHFLYNNDRDYVYQIGSSIRIKGPNFLPYKVNLDCFSFVEPFENQVEAVTTMTLQQLRLCFVSLKNYICDRWSEEKVQYTYLNRGLVFAEPSFLIDKLTECLQELCEIEGVNRNAQEMVSIFIKFLSSHEIIQQYDPLMRRGLGALYENPNIYTLDLNLIVASVTNLMMDLQLDNEMRQIKGSTFESHVANRLLSDCPAITMPIQPGLKLKKKGEQNPFAEVDAYVQIGKLLLLVDCKAYSLTREYFRGDFKAVTNRRILTEQWLDNSDRRGKEVAECPTGANYSIPREVTHLVPVVCSAFPEFWWTFDEKEFLVPKEVPRVCTFHELVELLNSDSVGDLAGMPFAIPIR